MIDRFFDNPEPRPVLTVEEAAKYLGVSRPTAYEAIHTGEIPHIRIGRRILIPRAALEKMLLNCGKKKRGKKQ